VTLSCPPPRRNDDVDDPDDEGVYIDPAEIPEEPDIIALHEALLASRHYASKHARAYTPPAWLALVARVVGRSNPATTAGYDRRPDAASRAAVNTLLLPCFPLAR